MVTCHTKIKSFVIVISRSHESSQQLKLGSHVGFRTPKADVHISVESASQLPNPSLPHQDKEQFILYVLGDAQDFNSDADFQYLGNGLTIRCSPPAMEVEVCTSITGMPAAFLYRDSKITVVASDIHKIAAVPGLQLEFDPRGLAELATIGHPIHHRTLFKGVSIVPAGARLTLVNGDEVKVLDNWAPPSESPFSDWSEYIDAQIGAMKASLRRLDLSHSFLSLTAGLDTRAIFALLMDEGVRLPAFTMSGERASLDALRARQLCDAYGLPHRTVSIDAAFVDGLPAHALEASRLSGGLGGLGQAFEIYFYKNIPSELGARISGNLGNQIGRSGTEGTGMRNVSLDALAPDLKVLGASGSESHWFKEVFPEQKMMDPKFLIQNENLYASLGNYCIGNHFAVQQTPYADRTVIEQKLRQPPNLNTNNKDEAIWRIKLRDLRHRIVGQPVEYSFQRRIVKNSGKFVANCPINWGWRASGGVSIGGLTYGAMAMTDALLGSKLGRHPIPTKILTSVGIHGFSGFQAVDILGKPRTRQFVADTLLSSDSSQSGILNRKELERLVKSWLVEPRDRSNIEFALDVVLAQQNFLNSKKNSLV